MEGCRRSGCEPAASRGVAAVSVRGWHMVESLGHALDALRGRRPRDLDVLGVTNGVKSRRTLCPTRGRGGRRANPAQARESVCASCRWHMDPPHVLACVASATWGGIRDREEEGSIRAVVGFFVAEPC